MVLPIGRTGHHWGSRRVMSRRPRRRPPAPGGTATSDTPGLVRDGKQDGTSEACPRPPRLYTPAEAAELLTVPESWLRRQAGQRRIPCTYLGKHLRFSTADLRDIIAAGGREPPRRRTAKSTS